MTVTYPGASVLLSSLESTSPTEYDLGNPTGTVSAVGVMMGLGSTLNRTPTKTGIIRVVIRGTFMNDTAGDGAYIPTGGMRYKTGAASANGDAIAGTSFGPANGADGTIANIANNAASQKTNFCVEGFTPALTLNTLHRFDVVLVRVTGGTASITAVTATTQEVN